MKMLNIAIVLLMVLVAAGCATTREPVVLTGENLVERDGLWYQVQAEKPFTGMMAEYWPGGEKKVEAELVDGQVSGRLSEWHEDGRKSSQTEYREGKLHGKAISWYDNGQKQAEVEFQEGEEISRREWDEEGNPIDL